MHATLISSHTSAAPQPFLDDNGYTLNTTEVCLFWLNEASVVAAARVSTIQSTLNNRLTVAATVGDTALASAVTAVQTANPEVSAVILADTGADPVNYPYLVSPLPCSTPCITCLTVFLPYVVRPSCNGAVAKT